MDPLELAAIEAVVGFLLQEANKLGLINEAQKLSLEALAATEEFLGGLQIYYQQGDFPRDLKAPLSASNIDR